MKRQSKNRFLIQLMKDKSGLLWLTMALAITWGPFWFLHTRDMDLPGNVTVGEVERVKKKWRNITRTYVEIGLKDNDVTHFLYCDGLLFNSSPIPSCDEIIEMLAQSDSPVTFMLSHSNEAKGLRTEDKIIATPSKVHKHRKLWLIDVMIWVTLLLISAWLFEGFRKFRKTGVAS